MKLFWGLIAVLLAAAAYFAVANTMSPSAPTAPLAAPVKTSTGPAPEAETNAPMAPAKAAGATPAAAATPATSATPASSPTAAGANESPISKQLDELLPGVDSAASGTTKTPEPNAAETKPTESSGDAAYSGAKVVKQADGSLLVDGRFVVKGEGTKENPYLITWELLVSANESYDPKAGKKDLPGRLKMLDGKHVRLAGNIAFPLYVDTPKELLSMLNQWDGCCIGVPPTPYDAVEVHLSREVPKDQRLATFGTVEGTLSVKPYLVGEWLVGLYVMEDASFSVRRLNVGS